MKNWLSVISPKGGIYTLAILGVMSSSISWAQIGISTPSVTSGELIRAADWNKIKLDLETLAAAVGVLQNSSWGSSGSDTYYNTGNVGIGTTSPSGTVHIYKDSPVPNAVLLQLGTSDDADRALIDEDGDLIIDGKFVVRDSDIYESGGDLELSGEDSLYLTADWNNNDADTQTIYFGKNSDGAGPNFVELMRINENGTVGIGTALPSSRLHVAGAIQVGGDAAACDGSKAGAMRYNGGAIERCDGSNWDALATTSISDNLGNHLATQDIDLGTFRLVGNAGADGIEIAADGKVGIGGAASSALDVISSDNTVLTVRTSAATGKNAGLSVQGAEPTSTTANVASLQLVNNDASPFEGARIALLNGDTVDGTAMGDMAFYTNIGTSDNLTEKMRILSNGNVGIGITNPPSLLTLRKIAPAPNEVLVEVGTDSDSNRFSVDEDGDVFNDGNYYIGGGNVVTSSGSLTVGGEDNLYLSMDWNDNDAGSRSILFGMNGVGGGGGWTELMRLNEDGRFGVGLINPASKLHVQDTQTADRVMTIENRATTSSPEGLLVLTGQGAGPGAVLAVGTGTEAVHTKKFVVTNEGYVGIGTAGPGVDLEIVSADTQATVLQLTNTDTGGGDYSLNVTGSAGNGGPGLFKVVDQGAGTDRLVIDGSGNVGIGTTEPNFKLHVSGGTLAVDRGSGTDTFILRDATFTKTAGTSLNINTGLNIAAGGGGVPGLASNTDINTGLQWPSSDNLSILTNGGERLRIDPTGEIDIKSISSDGTGKVVCIKNDGNLGTCTDAPDGTGACTCS